MPWYHWYSVWSHRRSQLWKGYLEIDLAPDKDHEAHAGITMEQQIGGMP